MDVWRERMRVHAGAACRAPDRQRAGGAGSSIPHTHAQLFALQFVPRTSPAERERFGAYATAHDGREPARRPRPGGGPQARAGRRDRRRGGADRAVRLARALTSCCSRRGRRGRASRTTAPSGAALLHDALGRLARRARRRCRRCNLWVRTAPQRRRALLLADRHPAAADADGGPRARRRAHLNTVAPEHAAVQLREA